MPVNAYPEQDQIQRPVEPRELRVGDLSRRPIVAVAVQREWQDAGALWLETPGNHGDIAQRAVRSDQAVVGRDDGHVVPIDRRGRQSFEDRRRRLAAWQRDQRLATAFERRS